MDKIVSDATRLKTGKRWLYPSGALTMGFWAFVIASEYIND